MATGILALVLTAAWGFWGLMLRQEKAATNRLGRGEAVAVGAMLLLPPTVMMYLWGPWSRTG